MKTVELQMFKHDCKVGAETPTLEPNVTEDTAFTIDGKIVGFYMRRAPEKIVKLATLCNHELGSDRVPKAEMTRLKMLGYDEHGKSIVDRSTRQYSAILGAVAPKPHMRRNYATISSVHSHESAKTFVTGMLMLVKQSEELIKEIMPEQFESQQKQIQEVPEKYRFGRLFTSSISNYNISAHYHVDTANIKDTVNVIITKRLNATGGNLHVPDHNLVIDQCDNSVLVYPAWRSLHGVTPIIPTFENGYRNSLIFYPLKAFINIKD